MSRTNNLQRALFAEFSPLLAELGEEIVPISIKTEVSMFHGTASGFKFLDPVFFLMNPYLICSVEILDKLPRSSTCQGGEKTKFEVGNLVQKQIAKALGFESTSLSRKDKYLLLTGNEMEGLLSKLPSASIYLFLDCLLKIQ